ncbi:LysR family transcriptional regulator [Archangium violaceum]|uniref:LysR substrate-binding domain-containing protein n=1 Tax=Archangium violaceum TaxID=83451 RepID=UPI00193C6CB1|nr:LysR substrate-binding domain-containing protein [Archangium violaceum]QRK08237.1 LysR family transcriptional regulator [Archangium violaceum]
MSFTPLNGLHSFVMVARRRGFSAAARELGVSVAAVSQSVRSLESRLGVTLLYRTTRSVAPTEAGQRLLERSGAALEHALDGLRALEARGDEVAGTVRLAVPSLAMEQALAPVVSRFLEAYPKVSLDIQVDNRRVDIVREGFDGGVRRDAIPQDMARVRLGERFRFLVVGAPAYLARRGEPRTPEDLLLHACLGMREEATGAVSRWNLESGKRSWRLPVVPMLVCNDRRARVAMAEAGMGLTYEPEPGVLSQLEHGTLRIVLEKYAAWVPGFFLYFPSREQASPAFRAFIDMVDAQPPPTRAR